MEALARAAVPPTGRDHRCRASRSAAWKNLERHSHVATRGRAPLVVLPPGADHAASNGTALAPVIPPAGAAPIHLGPLYGHGLGDRAHLVLDMSSMWPRAWGACCWAVSLVYILAVLLGAGPRARAVRPTPRSCAPRHGTRHRLSALSVAILALSLGRFARARDELYRLLAALARGTPATEITR